MPSKGGPAATLDFFTEPGRFTEHALFVTLIRDATSKTKMQRAEFQRRLRLPTPTHTIWTAVTHR